MPVSGSGRYRWVAMAISGVADLTGRVLAGRYRLLAPIGAGASGRVYVADDVRLRRRVAVKVLHAALADDAGFLRRFRAEAQVAASLHHPNVMAVYDWGEDDVPFMVLELLHRREPAGPARRRRTGSRPSQAAHVGRQVTSALEYAHARGLVHRDIKPANLLFDEHGIVRVADFGLARALAEASWTEPAGAVVGTARYAAPEQATGAPLDGRADLYSLAIVLVECGDRHRARRSPTPPSARWPRAHAHAARRAARARSPRAGRSSAPADPIRPSAIPTPPPWAPRSPTPRACCPPPQPLALAGLGGEIDGVVDPTQIGGGSTALFDQDAPAPTRRTRPGPSRVHDGAEAACARLVPLGVGRVLGGDRSRWSAAACAFAAARRGHGRRCRRSSGSASRRDQIRVGDRRAHGRAIIERNADDPKGVVIAQHPRRGSFAGDDAESSSSCRVGRRRCRSPTSRTLSPDDAQARARGSRVRRRTSSGRTTRSVPSTTVDRHRSGRRRAAAARLDDHVARERRSRAGAGARRRRHELRRSRASAHRHGFAVHARATTSATPSPRRQGDRHRSARGQRRERAGRR